MKDFDKCEHEWACTNDGWYFTLSKCQGCGYIMEEDSTGVRYLAPRIENEKHNPA